MRPWPRGGRLGRSGPPRPERLGSGEVGDVEAALGFGVLAAQYVGSPEVWPGFIAWARGRGVDVSGMTIAHADQLTEELGSGLRAASILLRRGTRPGGSP